MASNGYMGTGPHGYCALANLMVRPGVLCLPHRENLISQVTGAG